MYLVSVNLKELLEEYFTELEKIIAINKRS